MNVEIETGVIAILKWYNLVKKSGLWLMKKYQHISIYLRNIH